QRSRVRRRLYSFPTRRSSDLGMLRDEHASLAKVFCTLRTRDIVSQAREVMGGNGILLAYDVARFLADAEAIYSYEGTKEINSLRSEEHTSELQSRENLVCRLL